MTPPAEPTRSAPAPAPLPIALPQFREQTIEALSNHFAADRLSIEEFEHRVSAVYAATTADAVRMQITDLQPEPAVPSVAADALRVTPSLGTSSLAEQNVSVILGNHERAGQLTVPARLNIRCVLGNVELDLRDATFTAPVTEIVADAVLGNIELTVPAGVRVESEGNSMLGSFASTGSVPSGAADVVIRLKGAAVLASVEVHHAAGSMVRIAFSNTAPAVSAGRDPQRLLP